MPRGLGLTMALRSVSALLEKVGHAVWRADALAGAISTAGVVASGHHDLDAQLPGGGWPVGALCELLQVQGGQLEWRLLLPALRGLSQAVVLVAPPWVPYGPGLQAQGLSASALIWVQVQASLLVMVAVKALEKRRTSIEYLLNIIIEFLIFYFSV